MCVISLADPEHPEEVGHHDRPGLANCVAVSGDYAYVVGTHPGMDAGHRLLVVISVADPEHPEEVGYCDMPEDVYSVTVSGDYAFVATSVSGLRVVNISDPENPVEVGYYDTPGRALGVTLSEDGLIYVADGTNVGIYRFTDPANVDDSFIPHPSAFILHPAYPNPFNSTTTITYGLPVASSISLILYDLSGRLIQILVDEEKQAGVQTTILNAAELPSGLYFVRLSASGHVFTRKVMLVR